MDICSKNVTNKKQNVTNGSQTWYHLIHISKWLAGKVFMKLRWFGLSRLLQLMQSKFLFLLANDNEVICEFPNYERDSGIFDSIKDIGFTDVNADGVEDIILVIDSIINDDSDDPVVQSNAVIYLTGENEFQFYK